MDSSMVVKFGENQPLRSCRKVSSFWWQNETM